MYILQATHRERNLGWYLRGDLNNGSNIKNVLLCLQYKPRCKHNFWLGCSLSCKFVETGKLQQWNYHCRTIVVLILLLIYITPLLGLLNWKGWSCCNPIFYSSWCFHLLPLYKSNQNLDPIKLINHVFYMINHEIHFLFSCHLYYCTILHKGPGISQIPPLAREMLILFNTFYCLSHQRH